MPAEDMVIIASYINRSPDRLLEFLHGIENTLHQVQPDDVLGGASDSDM